MFPHPRIIHRKTGNELSEDEKTRQWKATAGKSILHLQNAIKFWNPRQSDWKYHTLEAADSNELKRWVVEFLEEAKSILGMGVQ